MSGAINKDGYSLFSSVHPGRPSRAIDPLARQKTNVCTFCEKRSFLLDNDTTTVNRPIFESSFCYWGVDEISEYTGENGLHENLTRDVLVF